MDFDLWTLTEHDCDLGHCSYDSDSFFQKPLNTIEYNGLYIVINYVFKSLLCYNSLTNISETVPNSVYIVECTIPVHFNCLQTIHDIIIFKILLLTHKAVNNTAPEYLCDLIRLNVKSTTIRTRASFNPCLLCVPPISKTCANSFFDRSFVYAAPTLWNALDLDIRLLPFDTFKKRVKTHLYLKYFGN